MQDLVVYPLIGSAQFTEPCASDTRWDQVEIQFTVRGLAGVNAGRATGYRRSLVL